MTMTLWVFLVAAVFVIGMIGTMLVRRFIWSLPLGILYAGAAVMLYWQSPLPQEGILAFDVFMLIVVGSLLVASSLASKLQSS